MGRSGLPALSRRERQILDILLEVGQGTAGSVRDRLPSAPSYSAVRTMLGRLEDKGYIDHEVDGPRYVYRPAIDPAAERESALERTVRTFFDGSPGKTVAALLDRSSTELTDDELGELAEMIDRIRRERD